MQLRPLAGATEIAAGEPTAWDAAGAGMPERLAPRFDARHVAAYSLVMLIVWLPYVVWFFPGIMEIDTIFQVAESSSIGPKDVWTSLFPYGTTVAYGFLFDAGRALFGSQYAGVATMLVAQVLLLCVTYSALACYTQRWGVPCAARYALLAVAAIPTVGMQVVDIGKDAAFAPFLAANLICLSEGMRTSWRSMSSVPWCAASVASAVLMCLTRSSGFGVVVLSWSVAFLSCGRASHRAAPAIAVCAVCASALATTQASSALYRGRGACMVPAARELLGTPIQQVTHAASVDDDLSGAERDAVAAFMDLDRAKARYTPPITDGAKSTVRGDAGPGEAAGFVGAWLSVGARHPDLYGEALWDVVSGFVLTGTYDSTAYPRVFPRGGEPAYAFVSDRCIDSIDGTPIGVVEALSASGEHYNHSVLPEFRDDAAFGRWELDPANEGARRGVWRAVAVLSSLPVTGLLVSKSAWALWLPLCAVVAYVMRRARRRGSRVAVPFAVLLPMLLMSVLAFISPVDLARYVMPSMIVVPPTLATALFGSVVPTSAHRIESVSKIRRF